MRLIYLVDVIVVSVLLYLIVSAILASKQYLDEAMDKGLLEKLHYMLRSLIELLYSIVMMLILAIYICVRAYVGPADDTRKYRSNLA
jgi:Trk-type K+ transport system membrane component